MDLPVNAHPTTMTTPMYATYVTKPVRLARQEQPMTVSAAVLQTIEF